MNTSQTDFILTDAPEADKAFDAIQLKIISGAYQPGSRLNETELSRQLGINRGAVREAIRRLESRRLVLYTPNVGARVVLHTPQDITDAYELREVLEGTAARLCAERMSELEIRELRQSAVRTPNSDSLDGIGINTDFHVKIARGSRNGMIERILNEDFFQLLKFWTLVFPWVHHSDPKSDWDHERIAEAIAFHDGTAAEVLTRNHVRRLRIAMVEKLNKS